VARPKNALPMDLVRLATRLAQLQARRRREMRKVRLTTAEIRAAKRNLKALADSLAKDDPFDQVPPMRFERGEDK
jgi:hypothetical protein